MKNGETSAYYGEFPIDLCSGKQLSCIFTNIIEYQYVGDTKTTCFESLIQNNDLKTVVSASLNQLIEVLFPI